MSAKPQPVNKHTLCYNLTGNFYSLQLKHVQVIHLNHLMIICTDKLHTDFGHDIYNEHMYILFSLFSFLLFLFQYSI